MTHSNLLKRFEYSIPGSNENVKDKGTPGRQWMEMNLPLVKVNIDFERRDFSLEGSSLVTMTSVRNSQRMKSTFDSGRIKVKASFYSCFNVDLSDLANNGLVFPLKGIIQDSKNISSCSGLLALDRSTGKNWLNGKEWCLTIYLQDDFNVERAIELRLTMYSLPGSKLLN
jgi:hypothetical protein